MKFPREAIPIDRFLQILDINTAFMERRAEGEWITTQGGSDGRVWAKNVKFGDEPVYRSWRDVSAAEPVDTGPRYTRQGRYIVTTERFPRIVGRIFGGDGYMSYQLAARPYDEVSVSGFANEEAAYAAAISVLHTRELLSLGGRIL